MDEDEIAAILEDLEDLLTELGLGFVVHQEQVLAAEGVSQEFSGTGRMRAANVSPHLGKLVHRDERFAEAFEFLVVDADLGPRSRSARKSDLPKSGDVARVSLDPRSRLAILLDLVEVLTAGSLSMEDRIRQELDGLRTAAHQQPDGTEEQSWAAIWDGRLLFEDRGADNDRTTSAPGDWALPTPGELDNAHRQAQEVVDTLNELRRQASLWRGPWLEHTSAAEGTPGGGKSEGQAL